MSKRKSSCDIYVNGRFLTRQITGVERFSLEITRELIKLHPEIKIVAPRKAKKQQELDHANMIYTGVLSGHLWEQIILPLFLKRSGNPVLLNFANTAPLVYKRKIITLHDIAFKDHPEWFSKRFSRYYNFLIPKLIASSKHILTVSGFSKSKIKENFNISDDKISVIYNGISADFLNYRPQKKPFDFDYYLTVGTLQPRKNLKRLLEAYQQIPEPACKLVIAGNFSKIFNDDQVGLELSGPNIIIKEKVNDEELSALYQHAEKFIYPSLYEGFGLPVLEAIHFSCPVVASDLPVFRELFGDIIDYFNPYDIRSIKNGMEQKTALNQSSELIKQIKKYNFTTSAKKILGIIEKKKDSICA